MGFRAALWAEGLKVRRSKMPLATILGFMLLPVIGGLFMFIIKNPELAKQLGIIGAKTQLVAGTADWPTYFGFMNQGIAIGGVVLFGFVATWIFGREYSDRTAKDLAALPTPRGAIVSAKVVTAFLWCVTMAVFVFGVALVVGKIVDLPQWSTALLYQSAGTYAVTAGLSILLVTPVAFIASADRGYLPPMGFIFLVVIMAQVLAVLGWAGYFPWAIPALYSGISTAVRDQVTIASYFIVILISLGGYAATYQWWRHADQA